jgi:hypothetical protein
LMSNCKYRQHYFYFITRVSVKSRLIFNILQLKIKKYSRLIKRDKKVMNFGNSFMNNALRFVFPLYLKFLTYLSTPN